MLLTQEPSCNAPSPKTLRYRLLNVAARITQGQRRVFLHLAEALALARAFGRLRQIPLPA